MTHNSRGFDDVVMVTLGTGVGGAAMIEDKLLRGKHFQVGCLESRHGRVSLSAFDGSVSLADSCAFLLGGRSGSEKIAITDDGGGRDQQRQPDTDQRARPQACSLPLAQGDSPDRAENNDAGHVQGPTREAEFAHLRLPHRVEKKLHVPRHPGQRAEVIITQ